MTRPILFAAALALLGSSIVSHAQTLFYWSGDGTNSSFVTAGNFKNSPASSTNATPTSADTTQLVFGARNAVSTVASNATAGFNVSALIFSNTALQSYTITGAQIEFKKIGSVNPLISQQSSQAQSIATGIKLAEPLTLGGDGSGLVTMTGAWEAGSKGIVKTGTSDFFLNVASIASSGTVTISNGTLAMQTNSTLAGGVIELRGGVLATRGTFSRALGTSGATVNFGAGGGGFAAYGGALTVSTALGTWGTTASSLANGTPLILGSRIANNVVTLSSALALGGAAGTNRVITLVDNTNSAEDAALISGAISGAANLQITGSGLLSLTGATNSYGGTNTIGGVTLRVTTLANAGTNSSIGTNATIIITNGGVLEYVGTTNSSMNRVINLAAGQGGIGVSNSAAALTVSGVISNSGSFVKTGAGTLILSASNTYTGATTISGGTLLLSNAGTISTNTLDLAASGATLNISNITAATVNVAALSGVAGSTVSMGARNMSFGGNNASTTFAGVVTGSGNLTKNGTGTTTLSGANTYTGSAIVSAGTLQLNNSIGSALGSITNLSVATNAVLLVSQSNQVNNASAVSLSGGTIRTPAGISETFGNLSVTGSGTLDFGATFGNASSMNFGTYTPSALLTLNNFNFGSTLTFKTDLTSSITNSSFFTFNNGGISSFNWNAGTSTFTITAIPEPSTYLAAAGLLGLMLWPSRRRIIRDAKKILGLRAPMRDRLAALRDS